MVIKNVELHIDENIFVHFGGGGLDPIYLLKLRPLH